MGDVDHSARGGAEPKLSRRSMLTVGVPAVLTVIAVGSVPVVIGSRGRTHEATSGIDATTTSPPTTDPALTPAASTETVVLPGASTTTTGPAATTTTTTTVAPTTTVAEESGPIAPPGDTRGFEELTQLGSITIPKLGVDEPLLEGIRLTTLDVGPGHWPGSAMPGDDGNVVVAAHRTSHGAPFRHIDQLVAGDIVEFTTLEGDARYEVTGTQIVDPDALWIVDPTPEPTATLFACHPPGSVAHRIVVNLELVV
ncbi:sortase [Ilumatobacter sp.]|uniref:sortase n=1 Tax=Ilumatobacter sp. TaxID=1967498 RepID=UPI003C457417